MKTRSVAAIARKRDMSTPVAPAKKRRLKWTCRYCGHTFSTWTRRGLRVTCRNPKCGRVQEGPAGIELMAARLGELQPARRKTTEIKVVTTKASPSRATHSVARAAAAPARPAATATGSPPIARPADPASAPAAQTTQPATAPSFMDNIGRAIFGGGKS